MEIVSKEVRKRDAAYLNSGSIIKAVAKKAIKPEKIRKRKLVGVPTTTDGAKKKSRKKATSALQRRQNEKKHKNQHKKEVEAVRSRKYEHNKKVRRLQATNGDGNVTPKMLRAFRTEKIPDFVPFKFVVDRVNLRVKAMQTIRHFDSLTEEGKQRELAEMRAKAKIWFKFKQKVIAIDMSESSYNRLYKYAVAKIDDFGMNKLKQYLSPQEFRKVEIVLGFATPFSSENLPITMSNFAFLNDIMHFTKPAVITPTYVKLGKAVTKKAVIYTQPNGKKQKFLVDNDRRISSKYHIVSSTLFDEGDYQIKLINKEAFAILFMHGAFDRIVNKEYSRFYTFHIPLWEYVKNKIGDSRRIFDAEDIRYFIWCNTVRVKTKKLDYNPAKLVCVNTNEDIIRISRAEAEDLLKANPEMKYASKAEWKAVRLKSGLGKTENMPDLVSKSRFKGNKFIRQRVPSPEEKEALKQAKKAQKLFDADPKNWSTEKKNKHVQKKTRDEMLMRTYSIHTAKPAARPESVKPNPRKATRMEANYALLNSAELGIADLKAIQSNADRERTNGITPVIDDGPRDDSPKLTWRERVKKMKGKVKSEKDSNFQG